MVPSEIITPIVIGVVSFGAGFVSGYIFQSINKNRDNGSVVLLVVTSVWAISVLVDILSVSYETSPLIHGLMGAIVGFFYRPIGGKGGKKS